VKSFGTYVSLNQFTQRLTVYLGSQLTTRKRSDGFVQVKRPNRALSLFKRSKPIRTAHRFSPFLFKIKTTFLLSKSTRFTPIIGAKRLVGIRLRGVKIRIARMPENRNENEVRRLGVILLQIFNGPGRK